MGSRRCQSHHGVYMTLTRHASTHQRWRPRVGQVDLHPRCIGLRFGVRSDTGTVRCRSGIVGQTRRQQDRHARRLINKSNDFHATPDNLASDALFTDSINSAISCAFLSILRAKLVVMSDVDLLPSGAPLVQGRSQCTLDRPYAIITPTPFHSIPSTRRTLAWPKPRFQTPLRS